MASGVNLYNIFLGHQVSDFKFSTTPSIFKAFAQGIGGSNYSNILSYYYDNNSSHTSNAFHFKGNFYATTSQTILTDSIVLDIIGSTLFKHQLALDPKGIYTVIFRGDLSYSSSMSGGSWLQNWCGFHGAFYNTTPSELYAFAVIGDSSFIPVSQRVPCSPIFYGYANFTKYFGASAECIGSLCNFLSPNNNPVADSMISTYAHEIFEAATDSWRGWYRNCDGKENGDLCAYNYGQMHFDGIKHFNLQLGSNFFIVQQMWSVDPAITSDSRCVLGSPLYSAQIQPQLSEPCSATPSHSPTTLGTATARPNRPSTRPSHPPTTLRPATARPSLSSHPPSTRPSHPPTTLGTATSKPTLGSHSPSMTPSHFDLLSGAFVYIVYQVSAIIHSYCAFHLNASSL